MALLDSVYCGLYTGGPQVAPGSPSSFRWAIVLNSGLKSQKRAETPDATAWEVPVDEILMSLMKPAVKVMKRLPERFLFWRKFVEPVGLLLQLVEHSQLFQRFNIHLIQQTCLPRLFFEPLKGLSEWRGDLCIAHGMASCV